MSIGEARQFSDEWIEKSIDAQDGVGNLFFQAVRTLNVQRGILQLVSAGRLDPEIGADLFVETGSGKGGTGRAEGVLARHGLRRIGG